MTKYSSMSEMWLAHVPEYRSRGYPHFVATFPWDRRYVDLAWGISEKRCQKRLDSYLIPGELERSRGSIRFGHEKSGRGYQSERGDFCLLAGCVGKNRLTVFYRSLELIGGLHFDIPVWAEIYDNVESFRQVTVMAARAFVFGVRGRVSLTKERLYSRVDQYHRKIVKED